MTLALPAAGVAQPGFLLFSHASPSAPITTRWLDLNSGTVGPTLQSLDPAIDYWNLATSPTEQGFRLLSSGEGIGTPGLYEFRPGGAQVTVFTNPALTKPQLLLENDDGDWFTLQSSPSATFLFRVRNNTLTTVATLAPLTATGWTIDPATGEAVIAGWMQAGPGLVFGSTFLDLTNGAVRFVNTLGMADGANWRVAHDPVTDLFFHIRRNRTTGSFDVVHHDRNQLVSSRVLLPPSRLNSATDLVPANRRGSGVAHWALCSSAAGSGVLGLAANGTVVRTIPITNSASHFKLLSPFAPPLSMQMRTGPNDRTLKLNFPLDANKPYVAAFSLSGYRTGPTLPDGRFVPITPDALTSLSLAGGIPGLLDFTVGTLDANGEAFVRINGNLLGAAARGLKMWATALVLDPAAPSGVAEVAGPQVIVLK